MIHDFIGICEHLNAMKHNIIGTKRRDIHEDCPALNLVDLLKGYILQLLLTHS